MLEKAEQDVKTFKGGRLEKFSEFWKTMTNDENILSMVEEGVKIEFEEIPVQKHIPRPYKFAKQRQQKIDRKISQYIDKAIIEEVQHENGEFISNIFAEDKSDGDIRVIFDLTDLNKFVKDKHFKMETIEIVKNLIQKDSFMSSVDWKDAYYSVKVHKDYRKFLRFFWQGKLYQFTCLPNGLKSAPRVFTKITKVIFATARKQNITASSYIDDVITISEIMRQARESVKKLLSITQAAGFVTHPTKSELEPAQIKKHLGFMIDSCNMMLTIADHRVAKIIDQCREILFIARKNNKVRLQKLAQLVGSMISTLPANQYGRLDIRRVEKFLNFSLNKVNRDYSKFAKLNNVCIQDITRWKNEISSVYAPLYRTAPHFRLESDASDIGWGGILKKESGDIKTGGGWEMSEVMKKNNFLELQAAIFTILAFCKDQNNAHIHISVDNLTAQSYLNKQGGRKAHLNALARKIWKWAKNHNNWISADYLPGVLNRDADKESRVLHENLEWAISGKLFKKICKSFGTPDVDLFASRMNFKVEKYVSWKHDPHAWRMDAFSIEWKGFLGYAFPPFNQIARVLVKCRQEKAQLILICPFWPTQVWFTEVQRFLTDNNYFIFARREVSHALGLDINLPVKRFIAVHINYK